MKNIAIDKHPTHDKFFQQINIAIVLTKNRKNEVSEQPHHHTNRRNKQDNKTNCL